MSEADERVCIYPVILTDTWDQLQKGSTDTEMRPCTRYWKPVKGTENRSDVMVPTASNHKPGSSVLHSLEFVNEILRSQ